MSTGRIRPRLVAVWLLVAALIGVIVVVEMKERASEERELTGLGGRERMLLSESSEHIGALEIVASGAMHRFERDPAGVWYYHEAHAKVAGPHGHRSDPVLAETIARGVKAFGSAHREREFRLDPTQNSLGVTTPSMVILVYRPNETQPMAQFAVGDLAPDEISRYVLIVGSDRVVTVAGYQIENLSKLVETAKASAAAAAAAANGGAAPANAPGAASVPAAGAPAPASESGASTAPSTGGKSAPTPPSGPSPVRGL